MTPYENFVALLNSEVGSGNGLSPDGFREQFEAAARETIYNIGFPKAGADQLWNRFLREHAGQSLIAELNTDGTVADCRDLPTADAERYVAEHDNAVIIATWGA